MPAGRSAPTDAAWWADDPARPVASYDGHTRRSLYLPMADGTELAADLYLPAGLEPDAKIPALITQTIYGRGLEFKGPRRERIARRLMPQFVDDGETFARYGYASLVVDLRGSGASFGRKALHLMPDVVSDGREILDWIVQQPWSNGRVGATGISGLGMAAMWLATAGHPALKAVATRFSIFDIWAGTHPGGLLRSALVQDVGARLRALDRNALGEAANGPIEKLFLGLFIHGTCPVDGDHDRSKLAAAVAARDGNEYFDEVIASATTRDDSAHVDGRPLLDALSPCSYTDAIVRAGIPIYMIGGWWDGAFTAEMVNMYRSYAGRIDGCRLTIGPWDHGRPRYRSPVRARSTRPAFDEPAEVVRFFDRHLRADGPVLDEPPVHYFVQVAERWRAAETWPPTSIVSTLYLRDDEALGDTIGTDGYEDVVGDATTGYGEGSRYFTPPVGRAAREPTWTSGPPGSVSFRSAPYADDTEISGHVLVALYLSWESDDAGLFVYLQDEAPDGIRRPMTEDELSLRLRRAGDDAPYALIGPWRRQCRADALSPPGSGIERVDLELLPLSWLVRAGHRVVVTVAASDPINFPTAGSGVRLRLHYGPDHPSQIALPIVQAATDVTR